MNLKFKERYANSNSIVNLKMSLIPDDVIPFFMVDFAPKKNAGYNYAWHTNPSSSLSKMKSWAKYRYTNVMKYISTFGTNYNDAKNEIDQFISAKIIDKYYYNPGTVARGQIVDIFQNNQGHSYKDIITIFTLGDSKYGLTQGLLTTLKGSNTASYKVGTPLAMLVVKKDYIPVMKLQMLLEKPISYEYFEIWLSDEVLSLPDTIKKTLKSYVFDKFSDGITVKWKANMNYLSQGYKVPALETLADKKEWLVQKELQLRNALYGETNTLKTYTISTVDESIKDSTHPEVLPKPKKFVVELVD